MELKEYIAIFRKHRGIFFLALAAATSIGVVMFFIQPKTFQSVMMLNVTRTGSQQTQDYKYDGFYRLQADERFADTVVRWLANPRIAEDIEKGSNAGMERLVARRLSSQVVEVEYYTENKTDAGTVATTIMQVINAQAQLLNRQQQEEAWFTTVGNDPVVADGRTGLDSILSLAIGLGAFFGFWAVLLRHYFER